MRLTFEDRFWAKVEKSPDCWNWTGNRTRRHTEELSEDGEMTDLVERLRARAMDFSGPDNYLNEAADRIEQLETLESSALGSLGNALRERDELRRRAVDAEQENAAAWEENYELRALLAEIKKHVTLCRAGKVRNDDAAAAAYDLLARIDAALNGGRK